jgi:ParB-like chromosome segregation protein Spo0J
MVKKLNLNAIRIDGGTQSRVEIDNEAVADYAEAIKVGIDFPPIVVFHDGADYWLADGFHRYHAHKQAGKASIEAEVRSGTVREAILHSLGANCTHGLRRSNADKRKAVQTLLADAEWAAWSDRKIAEACGVTHPFVAHLRRPAVVTVTTQQPARPAEKVVTVTTPAAPVKPKRTLEIAPPPADDDALNEAQHTITELAQENEQLRDRLAVEAMDASEDEKLQAAETIRELRALVKTLEAELDAVKASRDTYMRESTQMKRQLDAQQRELKKLRAAA